ncbi:MAG TPA: hypothetical protein PLJ23_00400 [Gemmatimonadales bacterium]|jgi:hypothetical protein|nr:hypothetical protein [Gemmatimonadales bacterium]
MTIARIQQLADDPEALEALYRSDPTTFGRSLPQVVSAAPDSLLWRAWRARLAEDRPVERIINRTALVATIAIALLAGLLVRLPALALGEDWYYVRFAPMIVMLALTTYFWRAHRDSRLLMGGLTLTAVAAAWVSFLPGETDSVVMALLHLPIVFWALLGMSYTGTGWRDSETRIDFVRYNGELVILTALVGLGGMVFSGMTVALFQMALGDIAEFYFENIAIVGVIAVPVVATYLYDVVFRRQTGIPPVLARVFAPLFLVMATAYLAVAFMGGKSPFSDRSFLITCNGLLLLVLGIAIFSIVERDRKAPVGLPDSINLALVAVTLVINSIALAAIVFRLASFGFTPNRVAVLGANLVIMVHLARIGWAYLRVVRKATDFTELRQAVSGHLPIYAAWAAIVVFVLPLVFGFA